ncbi:hypothetical protein ACA910_014583 [Epithemia clementina (nom. ined.)]
MMSSRTTTTNKRPLGNAQLQGRSSKPPPPPPPPPPGTNKAAAAAAAGASTPSKSSSPPPSSGGSNTGTVPILLGGTALAAVAAFAYFGKDKMPWMSSRKDEKESIVSTDSAATSKDAAPDEATSSTADEESTLAPVEDVDVVDTSSAISDPEEDKESIDDVEEEAAPEGREEVGDEISDDTEIPAMVMNESSSSAVAIPEKDKAHVDNLPLDESSSAPKKEVKKTEEKPPMKRKEEAVDVTDISSTKRAIEQLQSTSTTEAAKSLIQSHQALWTSLDSSFFADLDSLSMTQLKARVVQLATEMKDRTQWEAVRLKEFLALKEKETAQQYQEVLQAQRLAFEDLLARRLREQDDAFHKQLKEALDAKDATIQSVVTAALEAQQEEHNQDKEAFAAKFQQETLTALNMQYGEQMAAYKQAMEKDLKEKVTTLQTLSHKLRKLEEALEASQRTQQGSSQAHKLSAAALALSEVLETHTPAAREVQALKSAAGQDGVIATVVRTLPTSVTTKGVPTLSELQTKFEENYSTCRQAALVPPGRPGLDGQLAGMLFAKLKYPPQPDDPPPSDEPNSAEYVLARARKHVQLGELNKAVDELEQLQGQAAFVIKDWKKAAMDRVAVEKAIKVIKLECALLHESVAK